MNIRTTLAPRIPKLALGLLAAGTMTASAVEHTYRYFRFTPLETREGGNLIQLSEFEFYDSSGALIPTAGVTVTADNADTPDGEAPPNAFDGDPNNKWLDFTYADTNLIFDFGDGTPATIDAYNYITGNDANGRDPVSWNIEGADDIGGPWTVIDAIDGFTPTVIRNTAAAESNFVLPAEPRPIINTFEFWDVSLANQQLVITENGDFSFYAAAEYYEDLEIAVDDGTPVEAVPEGETVVSLPDDSDSVVTLTATNPAGTDTAELFVRTVAPATRDVRYVRFTPVSLRGGLPIQMNEFEFLDDTGALVPVDTVADPGGTNAIDAAEGALNLIDGDTATSKWLSGSLSPLVFDFGATETISGYRFHTGNDAPTRDPIQWVLEGSTDGESFFYIDTMLGLDFPTPDARSTVTQDIPLPADGSMAPIIDFSTDSLSIIAEQEVTLSWDVSLAGSVDLQPQPGAVSTSDSVVIDDLTETTTFTLTATSPNGRVLEEDLTIGVSPPFDGDLDYPDFDDFSGINPVGSTEFVNVHGEFPADPDARRLRLTDVGTGQQGSAWYFEPIDLSGGFETGFTAGISHPAFFNGADGMAFVIQNAANGSRTTLSGSLYPPLPAEGDDSSSNSLVITLDTFQNGEEPSNGFLDILVNGTSVSRVDLTTAGLGLAKGADGNYLLTGVGGGNNYEVTVTYLPGDLDVTIDGTVVIDSLDVDLGTGGTNPVDVLDGSGEAYVGFTGRTGGLGENHDILSWSLTTDATVPASPLEITDYVYDFAAEPATLTLTWTSEVGMTYDVSSSTTLSGWAPVVSGIAGEAGTTTATFDLSGAPDDFFRVEEAGTAP